MSVLHFHITTFFFFLLFFSSPYFHSFWFKKKRKDFSNIYAPVFKRIIISLPRPPPPPPPPPPPRVRDRFEKTWSWGRGGGFQARSKDQEILEEGGGAGPSLLPRVVQVVRQQRCNGHCLSDFVQHSSWKSNCAVHKSLGNGEGTPP